MSIDPPIQIIFSNRFKRDVHRLSKRDRRIRLDIQPPIEQLELGKLLGDQIPDIGYTVFKVRLRNSSAQKGKSGGYASSTTSKLVTRFSLSRCTLNPNNLILLLLKSERS